MSVVDSSMPNYFAEATTLLTNAQEQADMAVALDAFGYEATTLLADTEAQTKLAPNCSLNILVAQV